MNRQPLDDLIVLDLSHILSGPFVTMTLGDFGARIIKIEPPGGDATRQWGPPFLGHDAAYFYAINRNKESVQLDLKSADGRQLLEQLVRRADVMVENFRPGTLDKLGFGFSRLHAMNSRLILCSISGFGQTGPRAHQAGFDQIAQGMSGLMSVTGEPNREPVRAGFSIGDLSAAMWALVGILIALRHRDRTDQGQWVDVSLLDSLISFQTFQAQNFFATGQNPPRCGSAHPNLVPYQAFKTQDGYVNVAIGNDRLWQAFCAALEAPWGTDPRYATNRDRVQHKQELLALIQDQLLKAPTHHWMAAFERHQVPAGPIYSFHEVFSDQQVIHRGLVGRAEANGEVIYQLNTPVKMSETPAAIKSLPPRLGEHTEAVRREFAAASETTPVKP